MNNSPWRVPEWETQDKIPLSATDKYLYDIRNGIERLRRTVSGVGMVVIVILVALTWFT